MTQLSLTDFGVIPKEWQYDEDTGLVMCRCPVCEGRLTISHYAYWNPYHFCPYCGEKLSEGNITAKLVQVYEVDPEVAHRVRREYGKE